MCLQSACLLLHPKSLRLQFRPLWKLRTSHHPLWTNFSEANRRVPKTYPPVSHHFWPSIIPIASFHIITSQICRDDINRAGSLYEFFHNPWLTKKQSLGSWQSGLGFLLWKPHLPFMHCEQLEGWQRGSGDQRQFLQSKVTWCFLHMPQPPWLLSVPQLPACAQPKEYGQEAFPRHWGWGGGDKYKTRPLASMLKYSPQNKAGQT